MVAIQKTVGKAPTDFNKWITYIHRETRKGIVKPIKTKKS